MGEPKKLDAETLERSREAQPTSSEPSSTPQENATASKWRGVPQSRATDTFASFDSERAPEMKAAAKRVRQVARGQVWCAFLYGGPGNGKTHLAIAALHEQNGGIFWKVPDLLAWLRRLLNEGIEAGWGAMKVEEVIETYTLPDFLLVLDDLGTENRTEWAGEQLYRILDGRYENKAPTIITSNVELGRVDERLLSRFRDGLVICDSPDQRGREGARE